MTMSSRMLILSIGLYICSPISGMEEPAQQLTKETVKQIAQEVSKSVLEEQAKKQAPGISAWVPSKTVIFLGAAAITGGLIIRNRWWATPTDLIEMNSKANGQFQNKLQTFQESFDEHMRQINTKVVTNAEHIGQLNNALKNADGSLGKLDAKFDQSFKEVTTQLVDYQTEEGKTLDQYSQKTSKMLGNQKKVLDGLNTGTIKQFNAIGIQIDKDGKDLSSMLTEKQKQMLDSISKSKKNRNGQADQLNKNFDQLGLTQITLEQETTKVGDIHQQVSNSIGSLHGDVDKLGKQTDNILTAIDRHKKSDQWETSFSKSKEGIKDLKQRLSLFVAAANEEPQS